MRKFSLAAKIPALIFLVFFFSETAFSASLEINNQSNSEILNILATPVSQGQDSVFLRLDLSPGSADKIENPGFLANLRVDTGLQLWEYNSIALKDIDKMLFCGDYPGCMAIPNEKGILVYQSVGLRELVPGKGEKPVCELNRFHPMMPMKEVCEILEKDLPRDDNGACLTGLGFAGKVWAARLAPFQDGPINENSLLEHMELRRPLSLADIMDVLKTLYKQEYVPWQAEFPGQDIDFADMTSMNEPARKDILKTVIEKFLKDEDKSKRGDNDAEANILLAPVKSLSSLANADNPPEDVQLFTMILKPRSSTLLLDVTGYQGEKQ